MRRRPSRSSLEHVSVVVGISAALVLLIWIAGFAPPLAPQSQATAAATVAPAAGVMSPVLTKFRAMFGMPAYTGVGDGDGDGDGDATAFNGIRIPLPTPWAAKVDPAAPLPEYPRPQMARTDWKNLNGVWEFEPIGSDMFESGLLPFGLSLDQKILVPFPVEAPLSGIGQHHAGMSHVLYRTTFTVPREWLATRRVMLHFGAVDWHAKVYINGQLVGAHKGGYDAFSFDVTPALSQDAADSAPQELVVAVFDPTEFGHIALGKQRLHPPRHPSSIWYTSATGIWQTVWLEPVAPTRIDRLDLQPVVAGSTASLHITAHVPDAPAGLAIAATATLPGRGEVVATGSGIPGTAFELVVPRPRLWSPTDPFLYDLQVQLSCNGSLVDSVSSYFGLRSMSLGVLPGESCPRPLLNGRFELQLGLLDQGYWPDGIYTAPTDEALRSDIEAAKAMGYNLLRKHIKVEPERWYYWADKLGILVWQDMPSMFWEDGTPVTEARIPAGPSAGEREQWVLELQAMVAQKRSHPCIVTWVVFNEGWGQFDTVAVVEHVSALDTSRLWDGASGWNDFPVGNLIDMHRYVGPDAPLPTATRASVLGEFGGLGLRVEGHLWTPEDAFCYEMQGSPAQLEVRYLGLLQALRGLVGGRGRCLSAAVYTELTDVEAEINGWITYDRRVNKLSDPWAVPAAHEDLLIAARALNVNSSAAAV